MAGWTSDEDSLQKACADLHKRIQELTESRDHWRERWCEANDDIDQLEKRIAHLQKLLDASQREGVHGYTKC